MTGAEGGTDTGSEGAPEPEVVRGLRAAAQVAGRSPSGIQKLIDADRLHPDLVDGIYVFKRAELDSVRREDPAATVTDMTNPQAAAGEAATPALESPEPATAAGKPADSAEIIASIFADLKAGLSVVDIVITRKLDPAVVRSAQAQYLELSKTGIDAGIRPADLRSLEFKIRVLTELINGNADGVARELETIQRQLLAVGRRLGLAR